MDQLRGAIEQLKNTKLNLTNYEDWQMWIIGGIGLALTLLGYKIKKIAFFVIWFLLGYTATGYLMPAINSAFSDIASSGLWQNLIPIFGGLLLGLMGFMIEKICLAGICFGLTMMITVQYFGSELQVLAIGAGIGVILGGMAVMMMKPATILATSIGGGYALTLAILKIFPEINGEVWFWPMIGISALAGSIIQFTSCRHD